MTEIHVNKSGGSVTIHGGHVSLKGSVNGDLVFSGDGSITLSGIMACRAWDRTSFTGTFDSNGFYIDYIGGRVFWVFATHSNLIEVIEAIEGGIR